MKGLKLSKTSWLILSAGIFMVVLAGLGLTRSQQLEEQTKVEEDLTISTMRVDKLQATQLRPQLDELQQRIEESESQLNEAKDRLRQTVISVDVTDKFFVITEYCGVELQTMSTSVISSYTIEGIDCYTTSITATVTGELPNIIDFIISLNGGYTTGYIQSTQISIPDESSDNESTAGIQMVVYSYEGN